MSERILSQADADKLMAMEKRRVENRLYDFPDGGGKLSVPLQSVEGGDMFRLDIGRGSVNLKKIKYQNRVRRAVVLVRLDVGHAPHRNPDGSEITGPHLHVYREGLGDKYAIEVPPWILEEPDNPALILENFMKYCNIVVPPSFNWSLF